MKTLLISVAVGIALTVVFGVLAGMGGGACHCSTPGAVLFPYMTLSEGGDSFLEPLAVLQFLIYTLAVAYANRVHRAGRPVVFIALLLAHVTFAALATDELAERRAQMRRSAGALDASPGFVYIVVTNDNNVDNHARTPLALPRTAARSTTSC